MPSSPQHAAQQCLPIPLLLFPSSSNSSSLSVEQEQVSKIVDELIYLFGEGMLVRAWVAFPQERSD